MSRAPARCKPAPACWPSTAGSSEDEARKHVKVYDQDYHDLLDDPDVEGVIIALPLHLHAEVAIEAMRAGKHVLTEKLMAHSIHECKEMGRVATSRPACCWPPAISGTTAFCTTTRSTRCAAG